MLLQVLQHGGLDGGVLLHQRERRRLVLQEANVTKLIDFVKADDLYAERLLEIRDIRFTCAHAGDAGAGEGDLRGGGKFIDHVGVAVFGAELENVREGDIVAVELVDAVRVVPHQRKVRRSGLHRSERVDDAIRVNDSVRVRVLRYAPDTDDGRILDPLEHRVHIGTGRSHVDGYHLYPERFADMKMPVVAGRGAEEAHLAALGPRFGTVKQSVRERRGNQIIHELQGRAAADDDFGGLYIQELREELSCGRNAGKVAVVADVERVVKAVFAIGQDLQHVVRKIELRLSGLAARHVELQTLCLNGFISFGHNFEFCLEGGFIQFGIRDHKRLLSNSYTLIIP